MRQMTVRSVLQMKQSGEKIAMMTAYDYPTAQLLDAAGMHILLVGDSLGMVVQGQTTTLPVTMDHMVYHTSMVARAAQSALVVTDMPFASYATSMDEAIRHAARIMQEGGAHAVKLEGGREIASLVERLVQTGIPVMGHIGLTPQSVHALGGFSVQGRTEEAAQRLLKDALDLQDAGAFAVVLEVVPAEVAKVITEALTIPTIGIGGGPDCDGQVLVFHDMVGYTSGYIPKHNQRYANLAEIISTAAKAYIADVRTAKFPGDAQSIHLKAEEMNIVDAMISMKGVPHANR